MPSLPKMVPDIQYMMLKSDEYDADEFKADMLILAMLSYAYLHLK